MEKHVVASITENVEKIEMLGGNAHLQNKISQDRKIIVS